MPPDAETASRSSTNARTRGGNVSRGREVRGGSLRESRQEAQLSFERASKNLKIAAGWLGNLSDDDRRKYAARYGVVLNRKLKELFPD